MQRLYDEEDRMTDEGRQFSLRVRNALQPIFRELAEQGYSMRDASHIAMGEVNILELKSALEVRLGRRIGDGS